MDKLSRRRERAQPDRAVDTGPLPGLDSGSEFPALALHHCVCEMDRVTDLEAVAAGEEVRAADGLLEVAFRLRLAGAVVHGPALDREEVRHVVRGLLPRRNGFGCLVEGVACKAESHEADIAELLDYHDEELWGQFLKGHGVWLVVY